MTERVRFTDLLLKIVDNRGRTCPTVDRGLPLIATNCVKNGTLFPVFEKVRYVSKETYDTWFRGHPEPGDLIFVCKGSPGQVCLTPSPVSFCIAQDMVAIRADPERVYPPYLFAALRSKDVQFDIGNMHVGTMIPHFKKGDFDKLWIPLPSVSSQRFIGDWHLALEEAIELNRRMNETLEAMAQAIFRDWFVDFGPVRRKLEGATDPVVIMGGLTPDPTRAAELAALFPMDFEASDFPIGWDVEPVIDQANWVNGAAYKKMHFVAPGEGLPVIKIAELKAGVTSTTGFTNTDLGSRYRIDDGELLFSWSGNPDTSIDTFIWTGGPAWLNQHIFAVRSNGTRTLGFLFAILKYLNPTFAEIARDKQTTGLGHVTKEDLRRLRQVVPDRPVEMAFDALMTPIFEKLRAAQLENRTLAETRDYLLPRLMSGAVRVGDTAATVA